MKFYTWKDVERYFLLHRASWESAIAAVDVYPTDITVYAKPDACDQVEEILRAMFDPIMMFQSTKSSWILEIGNSPWRFKRMMGVPKEEKYYRYFPMSCITRHLIRSRRR